MNKNQNRRQKKEQRRRADRKARQDELQREKDMTEPEPLEIMTLAVIDEELGGINEDERIDIILQFLGVPDNPAEEVLWDLWTCLAALMMMLGAENPQAVYEGLSQTLAQSKNELMDMMSEWTEEVDEGGDEGKDEDMSLSDGGGDDDDDIVLGDGDDDLNVTLGDSAV